VRPDTDLPALADAAARGAIRLGPLITEIGLDDLPAAVEQLRSGTVTARLVVRMD
jgi:Zn-dependent alcohol dehydrogenase